METDAESEAGCQRQLELLADSCARFAADLYFFVARRVIEDLGPAGERSVREGLHEFGIARGEAIRAAAADAGDPSDLPSFLKHYNLPMGRAWRSEQAASQDRRGVTVNYCPFADQWRARGGGQVGQTYCEEVDPAIREGFGPALHFTASRFILREGECCIQLDEMSAQDQA
jgi:hypothetical protein